MDSVLGNIGAPLRVRDENELEEDGDFAEGDEGIQGMGLVRSQVAEPAAHNERSTQLHCDRTLDRMEKIVAETGSVDEGAA